MATILGLPADHPDESIDRPVDLWVTSGDRATCYFTHYKDDS